MADERLARGGTSMSGASDGVLLRGTGWRHGVRMSNVSYLCMPYCDGMHGCGARSCRHDAHLGRSTPRRPRANERIIEYLRRECPANAHKYFLLHTSVPIRNLRPYTYLYTYQQQLSTCMFTLCSLLGRCCRIAELE